MNTVAITKSMIIKKLSFIPAAGLDNVTVYIDSLLKSREMPIPKNQSLKGIWKDAGFEKIADLEEELSNIRRRLHDEILRRLI